jgi:hypothetical protein
MNPSIAALVLIVLISGCSLFQDSSAKDVPSIQTACVNLCNAALQSGQYLGNGPCLSDKTATWNPSWSINDWACDVAHSPRQAIDNLPENQCHGSYHHFVEVNATCSLIRTI